MKNTWKVAGAVVIAAVIAVLAVSESHEVCAQRVSEDLTKVHMQSAYTFWGRQISDCADAGGPYPVIKKDQAFFAMIDDTSYRLGVWHRDGCVDHILPGSDQVAEYGAIVNDDTRQNERICQPTGATFRVFAEKDILLYRDDAGEKHSLGPLPTDK